MKGLILAAGLGTRLLPLTKNHAKPSLPVLGIPTLWFNSWHLCRQLALKTLAINVSHAPETLQKAAKDKDLKKSTGIQFHFSDESDQILGSSGALWKLKSWVNSDLLAVSNADTICFPSWKKMLQFHKERNALVTLHLRKFSLKHEVYTDISTDEKGLVLNLGEKKNLGVMFSGAYLINGEVLNRIPEGVSELRKTVLEPLIKEKKLFGFYEDTPWFDTGNLQSYTEVQFELLKKLPQVRSLIETKMNEVHSNCWVPKSWKVDELKFKGPCVITGEQKDWVSWNTSKSFGPNFIGIEAPNRSLPSQAQNVLVFGSTICELNKF